MDHPHLVEDEAALAEIVRGARAVAVVGMKDESDPAAPAHDVPRALQARGLRVLPVNPRIAAALGVPAAPDLASVSEPFDLALVFRRPEAIDAVADEVLALPPDRRPAVVWLQTGIRNDAAAARLAEAGVRVVQDRCLGTYARRYRPAPPPADGA